MIAQSAAMTAAMTVLSDAKSGAGIGTGTEDTVSTAVAIVATVTAIIIHRMCSSFSFDSRIVWHEAVIPKGWRLFHAHQQLQCFQVRLILAMSDQWSMFILQCIVVMGLVGVLFIRGHGD